jgi:hypothetical protein
MNPHLEQRLRKLEEKILAAQRRERHITIRWIGKGERRRCGLRYSTAPVADEQPKLPDADDHLASPQPTEPAPVPSDFFASDEAETQQTEAESPTILFLQAEPAKEMVEEQADDALD